MSTQALSTQVTETQLHLAIAEPEAPKQRAAAGLTAVPKRLLEGCRQATQRMGGAAVTTLGVTSALSGEGRSSVATGLALVQSLDHGRRTILVDLDFGRPSLHDRLGVEMGPGISALISGEEHLADCLQRVGANLWLLPVGESSDDAPRLLSRLHDSTVMAELAEWADAVICDLPPLLDPSIGLDAALLCTDIALVVRAGVTPMSLVEEAAALLTTPPPVILNDTRTALPRWMRRTNGNRP